MLQSQVLPGPQQQKRIHLSTALPALLAAIAAIFFLIHFLFFRYSFPNVNVDEASFFSPAHNLAEHGALASPVHRSFLPGAEAYTYWMPPLYFVLLAGWLKLAGSTVFAAKLLSFLFSLTTTFLLTRLVHARRAKLWMSGLFLICPFILITSAFIRMEALALLAISISIVLVKLKSPPYSLALLAGLCLMTHPLLLACTAALALAALQRGWKSFLVFSVVTAVVISPYLIYIFQNTEFFRMQMALQFARKLKTNLENLQASYLLQSLPLSILAFWCLWRGEGSKELKTFLATCLALTLLIILKSNEFNYQVYTVPYVLGCLSLMFDRHETVDRIVLPGAVYLFFVVLLFAKLNKYRFKTDSDYKSVISFLQQHPTWKGRHIYVGGNPDVANYFIEKGEDVQRQIPIASSAAQLSDQFDYVVEILNGEPVATDTVSKPWQLWPQHIQFSPGSGSYVMHVYTK